MLYNLGYIYLNGKYIKQDFNKAIHYFTLAADQNDPDAQLLLGACYLYGNNIHVDINKAIYYLTLSANHNNSAAQYAIGMLYLYKYNDRNRVLKGLDFLIQSSKNCFPKAYFPVAYFYHEGKYVNKDIKKALHNYKEASSFNNQYAKNNLGIIYKNGIGNEIQKNIEFAFVFFDEAIRRFNDKTSMYNLSHIYIYEIKTKEKIDDSIDLLIESSKQNFIPSKVLLLIALILKFGFEFKKIQEELDKKTNESNFLLYLIKEMAFNQKLNNKYFEFLYQKYETIDFLYNFMEIPIVSNSFNEQQIPQSINEKQKNITKDFYEGFENIFNN